MGFWVGSGASLQGKLMTGDSFSWDGDLPELGFPLLPDILTEVRGGVP